MQKPKPQGKSGAIRMGGGSAEWNIIQFPADKAEREKLIANLFVSGFGHYVAMQSEPSLAPFGEPIQNPESDLDFTVDTALGSKLMELAEFAPLSEHGPTFASAPKALPTQAKVELAHKLIKDKSAHQGGADRFLVLYTTELGFWIDPVAVELLRRRLAAEEPKFDRVYYLSPHDLTSGSVTELFPGKAHHFFGDKPDEQLLGGFSSCPHPSEMEIVTTLNGTGTARVGQNRVSFPMQLNYVLGTLGSPWP